MLQRCGRCKQEKAVEEFSPSYRGKIGTWCRTCFAAYARGETDTRADHDLRVCEQCGTEYRPRQLKASAKYCSRACGQEARRTSGRQRNGHLLRKYGITLVEYEAMLTAQSGGCAICGRKPEQQTRYQNLHVDHCHDTGKVRGLLCDQHNLLLGRFNDDPKLLRRAADYLDGLL